MKRYSNDNDRKGAVGYTRVSTVDQVKGYSLINQERAIKNKCLEDGLDLVGIFTDEGRSARTKDRPGFLKAVDAAIKNKDKVSSFIVYRWDRFSRDVKDHHLIKERLKKHGIALISVKEGRVDSSPTSKLAHDIAAAFNEYESRLIGDRAKNGMMDARRSGNMTNRPPQGYLRRTEGGNKRTIHHDPERAPLIKQAFEMFSEGTYSQKDITDHLNRIGYNSRK